MRPALQLPLPCAGDGWMLASEEEGSCERRALLNRVPSGKFNRADGRPAATSAPAGGGAPGSVGRRTAENREGVLSPGPRCARRDRAASCGAEQEPSSSDA